MVPAARFFPFAGDEDRTVPGFFVDLRVVVLPTAQFALVSAFFAAGSVLPINVGTMHAFAATSGAE